eukprot:TRINITY_DN23923_c0_g1_i1.p1 TRINITY_DN23923_c0_g1~~TRINITY_DN23923_c0_g1_i1.p1  ORF type:complete len:202 (-),score=55.00 TRINITY_DN23923_c0_g1_i1:22-627(-)
MLYLNKFTLFFFFFKQKTAYEMQRGLVGSEMCIRDSINAEYMGRTEEFLQLIHISDAYLRPALVTLRSAFFSDIIDYIEQFQLICLLKGILFCIVLIAAYLFFVRRFIIQLKEEIWETKGILNLIPTRFIMNNSVLKKQFFASRISVSYTHLTLPTILLVQISVVAVSLKKKNINITDVINSKNKNVIEEKHILDNVASTW